VTHAEEFALMKSDPQALFNYYLDLLQSGTVLDDAQVVKLEYCKSMLGLL